MTSSFKPAKVIWFCGLSGSGKTTIANMLERFLKHQNKKVLMLDGDVVRETYKVKLGFSRSDILKNNGNIAELCVQNSARYDYILVPVISPYTEGREKARAKIGAEFIETFIATSLEACIQRDVKGLYKKALANEIPNFIGVSEESPFEKPLQPEIKVETTNQSPEESAQTIIDYLNKHSI